MAMKIRASLVLWLALLVVVPVWAAPARAAKDAPPTLTLDAPAGKILPRNFRTCAFPLRHGEGNGPPPSRDGLDTLRISGSGEFSPGELAALAVNLPARTTIVDLRRESHGMLGDVAVSWFARQNQGNPGLDAAAVTAAEAGLLAGIDGKPDIAVAVRVKKPDTGEKAASRTLALGPAEAESEADAVAGCGIGSFRVAVSDHTRPDDAAVDQFLRFYRGLAPDAWLHFHCRAGKGRTTTFMALVDMLANAGRVSFEDILSRQHLLGGADLTDVAGKDGERDELARERLAFLRRFHDYAKANPKARPMLWREWLAGEARP